MASADGDLAMPGSSKKVRLACRRCRAKRVKCDGGIPACGNCARAGVPCVDVDGRNNGVSIPRDFATRCCARIKWLEESIKQLDPNFDLTGGPQVDMGRMDEDSSRRSVSAVNEETQSNAQILVNISNSDPGQSSSIDRLATPKRPYASIEDSETDLPVSAEARSVAIELGMLSLHTDSRQKHYLGSSSGLLFTRLLGLDSPQSVSSPAPSTVSTSTNPRRRLALPRCPSRETYETFYAQLAKELPSSDEATLLLAVYFHDINIDHPFMHPSSLISAYQALCECVRLGCSGRIDQKGWVEGIRPFPYNGKHDIQAGNETTPISIFTAAFHIFMAFSLAATVLTRDKNFDHSPTRFYRMAMAAASECFSTISVSALQGIMLLIVQGLIGPAGINIWTLNYIAMSHCIDLGIHREPTDLSELGHTALTVRRLIFHTVYSFDRSIAMIQGRPLGIRDETFDIRRPTLEDMAKLADESPPIAGDQKLNLTLPTPENMCLSFYRFQADQHISEIKLLFYRLPMRGNTQIWPTDLVPIQERMKYTLDNWLQEVLDFGLASEMEPDDEGALKFHCEKLKLELLYHTAVTLLFQPSQVFRSPTQAALNTCYQSSRRRLSIYKYMSDEEKLYYNWRNVHGIFSSGATIVYCFWASRELQERTPFTEAMRDLRTCSNLLSIGSQWWPSLRSGKDSFEKMVDITIKRLGQLQSEAPSGAHRRRRITQTGNEGSFQPALGPNLDMENGMAAPNMPMQLPTPHNNGSTHSFITPCPAQSIPNEFDSSLHFEDLRPDGSESLTLDSAMEDFLSEYLHGDWGWDPFSSSMDLSSA